MIKNSFNTTLNEYKTDKEKIAFLLGYMFALEGEIVNVHNSYGYLFDKKLKAFGEFIQEGRARIREYEGE